ncbi:hypothetical protein [Aliiruegeria lutimaris]|uniref:Uncharacterized protein n=1 Tax=Aliiruegeria lutimaris TaxID=571298 RepID=A0A1G9NSD0_9RHOB|nr:hypothetical protein [Aliiruegeria lutimaris]SDL89498.1 hypothetical protein SAMN04488026_11285 [Aliiruegeria lutimaris]
MSETQKKSIVMSRRAFFAGAVAAPIIAKAELTLPASAQVAARAVSEPVNIAMATGMNMFQRWCWWFDLAREKDGSFTLTSIQVPRDDGDEDEELYDLDPMPGLRTGEEIFLGLLKAYDMACQEIEDTDLDGAAFQLERIAPLCATDFRRAVAIHFSDADEV